MAYGLNNVRDSILYSYAEDFTDYNEFSLLYDSGYSSKVYPYRKFHSFDLDNFDEAQWLTEFCITTNDIYQIADVLQIPMKIMCSQRTVSSNIESICILLKRLA